MCRPGPRFWPRCLSWGCGFWNGWTRSALTSFAVAWLLMAPGCCLDSSIPEAVPALPVLTSLQRLTLDGVPGVWMDSNDAGRLALWIYDVTGIEGDGAVQ